tara:strand:+ start:15088 stop:15270 length:183 start_codon:yes stop_codon:yes gene_type:complete
MKCFVAIEEDLLMEIWRLDPTLVAPFSRPDVKTKGACHSIVKTNTTLIEPVEMCSMKLSV